MPLTENGLVYGQENHLLVVRQRDRVEARLGRSHVLGRELDETVKPSTYSTASSKLVTFPAT